MILWDFVHLIAINDTNLEDYYDKVCGSKEYTDEYIDIRDLPGMTINAMQPEDFEIGLTYKK